MTQRTESADAGPSGGFLAEFKDAVTTRAALLVLGVLALQLAFITSYIGAFHHPKPSEIPMAVAAPSRRSPSSPRSGSRPCPANRSTRTRSRTRRPRSRRSATGTWTAP